MNRFFFSTLIIISSLAAGAEDECSVLCEHITTVMARFANGRSQSDCLDEFKDHWGKAQGPYLKKMDEYSRIMSSVAADSKSKDDAEQRINANRKEMQGLKELLGGDRPEFEEPDDFRKRQEKAALRVEELESANQALDQNIQLLEHRIQDGSKAVKPSVDLSFKGVYESQLAYDNAVCDVGFYQIDKKCFPVHLKSLPKGGSEKKLDKHENFVVETSLTFDCEEQQLGSFKSTEEAKKFKEEFLTGNAKINYEVNIDISVTNGRKDVLIKEGGRRTAYGKVLKNFAVGGAWLVAKCLASSDAYIPYPNYEDCVYQERPVYKTYNAYFIDCKIRPTLDVKQDCLKGDSR